MKWLLAGASGFLGTALRVRLASRRATRWSGSSGASRPRPPSHAGIRTPSRSTPSALDDVDVVVNLCGVGVADWLWTPERRKLLRSSRVNPSRTLAAALADRAAAGAAPVLIQASGIAIYGTEHSSVPHTEDSPAGSDFLAQLVVDWEQAADPAAEAGVRVVLHADQSGAGPLGRTVPADEDGVVAGRRRRPRRRCPADADGQPRGLSPLRALGRRDTTQPPGRTT